MAPFRRGTCDRAGKRLVQGVEDKLVDAARIAETHLGLGRVHVDVYLRRVDLEEQHVGRVAVVMQHILVRLADRMGGELVAHGAAIDENVLGVPARARLRRQADRAGGSVTASRLAPE